MPDHIITHDGVRLFARESGVAHRIAAPVVFLHALGTDHRLWDAVLPLLPDTLRLIALDMRGHGRSDVPPAPYAMGALVADVEAVCAALGVKEAVVVGLSIGGMIAQGLAVKRLDLVRGLVLSNTAARIATPRIWADRIEEARAGGLDAVADAIEARWFRRDFRDSPAARDWDAALRACSVEGWCGGAAAIAGTDFYTPTSGLRLPTLGIAGSEDRATPPDLVRETVELIPGARFHLMRRSGHLPCVDAPEAFAAVLSGFLAEIGHG